MRTTFVIEIKADMRTDDPEARAVFGELLRQSAETLYSECAMLSRRPPTMTITTCDEEKGTIHIPLFSAVTHEEDYSESEGE
jgi:hypothetical protein